MMPDRSPHCSDLPEIIQLIADLDETRWTGRPGYAIRTMVGAALVKARLRSADLDPHRPADRRARGTAGGHRGCALGSGRATGSLAKLRDHDGMLTVVH